MRFQAGLGTEWKRKYKQGSTLDTLMLAQVINVNYKYNTVDLISLQHKEVFQNSYMNEGKFSARLPVEFSGRNQYGKPYGQINPIEVGTVVLIGFLNSDKNSPIVLSVIGNNDVNSKLARAPFSNADPNDETLKRLTNQKFSLYPSLTYDNIDGDGNRTVSFTGKSFLVMSAQDTKNSGMTDDNNGTQYEDLETSYYNDLELIEPMVGRAPNVLFKHQGVLDEDENPDNHAFMLSIAPDGTYRTSMVDKTEDWRTYFEMTPRGEARLRKQFDTKAVRSGFTNSELGLAENGYVYMRNGEMDLEVRPDGIYSQGKPLSTDLSGVWEELNKQNESIIIMKTSIERTNEQIKLQAEKIESVDGKVTENTASIIIMAEKIESKVTKQEVQDMIDTGLADITAEIEKVQADADKANQMLADIANDNMVTPSEKSVIFTEWDIIQSEYPSYISQATDYEVDSTKYTGKYNDLKAYIEPILADMDVTTNIDSITFRRRFREYYEERTALLTSILTTIKQLAKDAMNKAIEAATDASHALVEAAEAQLQADKANKLISDIASDNQLTAVEKSQLLKEFDIIKAEFPNTKAQGTKYEVSTDDYEAKYQAVVSFIQSNGIFTNMAQTTPIDGATLRQVFSDYYASKTLLLRAVADKAKDITDAHEGRIFKAETAITQTAEQIKLLASTVESIDDRVTVAEGTLTVQAELISSKVTKTEVNTIVKDAVDGLGGTNRYVMSTASDGWLEESTGAVINARNGSKVSHYIPVVAGKHYVASISKNTKANTIVVVWYDANKTYISGKSVAGSEESLALPVVAPSNAVFTRMSTMYSTEINVQFETGTVATDWNYAPEDVKNSTELATEAARIAKEKADKAEEDARKAQNSADVANGELSDMAKDSILSPIEKKSLLKEWEIIKGEYPTVLAQGAKYGLSTVKYTANYNALKAYVEPLFVEMDKNSVIIGSTLTLNFKNYYDERTKLLNLVADKAKDTADNAQTVADKTKNDLDNMEIGGYNYVAFSSADNEYPRLMIKNVGYYNINNAGVTFENGGMKLVSKATATFNYDIGTSNANIANPGLKEFGLTSVKVGQWLTFTADMSITGAGLGNLVLYTLEGVQWTIHNSNFIKQADGVTRLVAQAQVTANTKGMLGRIIYSNGTAGDAIWFSKAKIEVGTKSTAWSKSPLDVQNDIDNVRVGGVNIAPKRVINDFSTVSIKEKYKYTLLNVTSNSAGLMVDNKIFTVGKNYTFTFSITKTSGNITHIGGHSDLALNQKVWIDGVRVLEPNTYQGGIPFPNDLNKHTVSIAFVAGERATVGGNSLYIQPNRGGGILNYGAIIEDIQVTQATNPSQFSPAPEDYSADLQNYVQSRGENLVTNGTGLLGDNTNFHQFTFDGAERAVGAGSFRQVLFNQVNFTDEYIAVDVNNTYEYAYYAKTLTGKSRSYTAVAPLDVDKNSITINSRGGLDWSSDVKPTVVTLTKPLKKGDTEIWVSDTAQFSNANVESHFRSFVLWGYRNSFGYQYPVGYSRWYFMMAWEPGAVDAVNKKITLSRPFDFDNPYAADKAFPIGHELSRTNAGSGYMYPSTHVNIFLPTTWTAFSHSLGATGQKFPMGTAFIKLGWLLNREVQGDTTWVNGITFTDVTKTDKLQTEVNGKEGAIMKQSSPPLNPAVGLLWVDTSAVPNIAKRWTGAEWVKLSPTEANEVGAYNDEDGRATADRVSSAEEKITSGAIINTVLESEDFSSIFDTKANASDLDNLASQDQLQSQYDEYMNILNRKFESIDFTPYVKTTELEQTMKDFNFKISMSGGVNLIRNSLGFSGFDFWDGATGNFVKNGDFSTSTTNWTMALPAELTTSWYNNAGSNMYQMSSKTSSRFRGLSQLIPINVNEGENVTVSLDVGGLNGVAGGLQIGLHWNKNNSIVSQSWETASGVSTMNIDNLGTTITRRNFTFKVPVGGADAINLMIFGSQGKTFAVRIGKIKLERGDVATDWTPYPTNGTTERNITTVQSGDLTSLGYGSGFLFSAGDSISQLIALPQAGTYTLAFMMNNHANVATGINIFENGKKIAFLGTDKRTNGYEKFSYTFTTLLSQVEIQLVGGAGADATVSGIMMNIGELALSWQPYPTEIYNANVMIDINGIKVMNNRSSGYTVITPDEFSGYAVVNNRMERIFTLNGATTEVKQLKAEDRIMMNPITVVAVDGDTYRGWAFIGS